MALHLYDTATRSSRPFVSLRDGEASMYLCGATVQAAPHIGHIRSGVSFDVLARWLRASGYTVTFCRNVTDIDDKIIAKGVEESRPWWAVAAHYEREFTWAYDLLGCTPPTVEPRATGHVTQMVTLMQQLIDTGHAYAIDGDVYFDVRSFPEYGQLSGQRVDDLQAAGDSEGDSRKRDPRDFALWKSAKPGEPSWPTPWGPGRPGWHLECSAMAHAYLGPSFDIHGGGLDLIFPHHENEIAQSKAAGDEFARYWLHNAWVTTSGEKMSKSLGNSLLVREVAKRVRPIELRYYLASAHYRSMIEFSFESLDESAVGFRRLENFVRRATDELGTDAPASGLLPAAYAAALDDDLGVSSALAVLHDAVTDGNTRLAEGKRTELAPILGSVRSMLDVLGVDPLAEPWVSREAGSSDDRSTEALDALIQAALADRATARANRDFAAADAIRDQLRDAGIVLEDTPAGVRWSVDGGS